MDKFELLTQTAQILSAVIGRPETNEFVVVEMPMEACIHQGLALQGFRFLGLLGIVDGAFRPAMAERLSDEAAASITDVFALQVARITGAAQELIRDVTPATKDDFVNFAESLLSLSDNRT